MTPNLNLKQNIRYLFYEIEHRQVSDPANSIMLNMIEHLLFVDKQETLRYIKEIDDEKTMFHVSTFVFSSGITKFSSKRFVEACKKQMDRFKDSKCYPIMLMNYNNALKYLELEKKFKEERKVYMQRLKEGKEE